DVDLLDRERATCADELVVAPGRDLVAAGEHPAPVVDEAVGGEGVEERLVVVGVDVVDERRHGFRNGRCRHACLLARCGSRPRSCPTVPPRARLAGGAAGTGQRGSMNSRGDRALDTMRVSPMWP